MIYITLYYNPVIVLVSDHFSFFFNGKFAFQLFVLRNTMKKCFPQNWLSRQSCRQVEVTRSYHHTIASFFLQVRCKEQLFSSWLRIKIGIFMKFYQLQKGQKCSIKELNPFNFAVSSLCVECTLCDIPSFFSSLKRAT